MCHGATQLLHQPANLLVVRLERRQLPSMPQRRRLIALLLGDRYQCYQNIAIGLMLLVRVFQQHHRRRCGAGRV